MPLVCGSGEPCCNRRIERSLGALLGASQLDALLGAI